MSTTTCNAEVKMACEVFCRVIEKSKMFGHFFNIEFNFVNIPNSTKKPVTNSCLRKHPQLNKVLVFPKTSLAQQSISVSENIPSSTKYSCFRKHTQLNKVFVSPKTSLAQQKYCPIYTFRKTTTFQIVYTWFKKVLFILVRYIIK